MRQRTEPLRVSAHLGNAPSHIREPPLTLSYTATDAAPDQGDDQRLPNRVRSRGLEFRRGRFWRGQVPSRLPGVTDTSVIRERFTAVERDLNERSRSLLGAAEAKTAGYGGITAVSRARGSRAARLAEG